MTNEEAIFCEKSYIGETNCIDCKYYGTDTCQSRESHRMAIKALEQTELKSSYNSVKTELDAISRQMALDLCERFNGCVPYSVLSSRDMLPSVSTEKTGRWEEVQFKTIPCNKISKAKKCSVCGKRKDKYVTWNYCPNCGSYNGGGNRAKLEVEE